MVCVSGNMWHNSDSIVYDLNTLDSTGVTRQTEYTEHNAISHSNVTLCLYLSTFKFFQS